MHIAIEHLVPKQIQRHGMKKEQLSISKKALWKIALNYTKEAGVRQMERKIEEICRKAARELLEKKKTEIHVTERNLEKYLGRERYNCQRANEEDEVGIVRGLAWTSVGGDTLQIEVNVMPGKGELNPHRSAWGCDERVCPYWYQLYPLCGRTVFGCAGLF